MEAIKLKVRGLVQGVGFRPFVYRLAHQHGLKGWVNNDNEGVNIWIEGSQSAIDSFIRDLGTKASPASRIDGIKREKCKTREYKEFSIAESADLFGTITGVSPDIAVCSGCLRDMQQQKRRKDYPFLNCTNCGPRFSIIRDLPYDRAHTTMGEFEMCPGCREEYENIPDRRFHAQPTACRLCGPSMKMQYDGRLIEGDREVLDQCARGLEKGEILAIKGLGGYHLACNALEEEAVRKLRSAKLREAKPFAVMFRDLQAAGKYAHMDATEKAWLGSWRRPILILGERKALAPSVSNGFHTIGAMLPYLPFHYLLFRAGKLEVLVMTSGNLADEPIVISDEEARVKLLPVSNGMVWHNRAIHNRVDDAVGRVMDGEERLIRRARGYVPEPIRLNRDVEGILGTGAELVNTFCLGKGKEAIVSQHIGDLKNAETLAFYEESIERFKRLFRFSPERMACDMHPDYLSSRYAESSGIPLLKVQHHHAHIASVMAEHRLEQPVIGLSLDGTGYGSDGHIWGSEFLVVEGAGFERMAHFQYMALPGGDQAVYEPWRIAVSLLRKAFPGDDWMELPFLESIREPVLRAILQMLGQDLNCPLSSGAGRLFDAIAALTGLCTHAGFHTEAPMRLEDAAVGMEEGIYDYELSDEISFLPMIRQIIRDLKEQTPAGTIASRFHNTVVQASLEQIEKISRNTGIKCVALSGGVFQNKIILEQLGRKLRDAQLQVFTNRKVPANDGGISLGQVWVASLR